jgi:hypothetical protein
MNFLFISMKPSLLGSPEPKRAEVTRPMPF